MSVLPFLAVSFGLGAASLVVRRMTRLSTIIGVVGLTAAIIAAAAIGSDEVFTIGGARIVSSDYLRLFALLGSIVGLAVCLIGIATSSHPHAPGVLLAGLGAAALALALADARIAVMAATVGGLIGILVTIVPPATARGVLVAVRELRAIAVAGVLAIVATAWVARPLGAVASEAAVFGLAYTGLAAAVAIRFGAIPFHLWAARLADAVPEIVLPLLMAWGPAAFAVVALAWTDAFVAPLLVPLTWERAVIVTIGAASVVLGAIAALIQDDLEHVVGYTIVADAGVVILGLAALDPLAWEPARTWVLAFVMTRSAFAAWAVAVHGAFGTRRIPQLAGWARRAPALGIALVVITAASIGWPGLAAFDARSDLVDLALGSPLGFVVLVGALLPLAVYARLGYIGLRPPAETVASGASERPAWPAPLPARPVVGLSTTERAFERAGHVGSAAVDVAWTVPAAVRANRTPLVSVLVLVLAGLSFAVAAGQFGVPQAAAAVPAAGQPVEPGPIEGPGG